MNKHRNLIEMLIVSVVLFVCTFFMSTKIFTFDPLSMGCLPMDFSAVPFMVVLTKVLAFLAIFGFLEFVHYARKDLWTMPVFLCLFILYFILLLIGYPGYYMSDDSIIFGYATRYLPVYWHSYLTSLYYMVAMTLIPASTAPVIMNGAINAMVFSYLYRKGGKRMLICALLPFTLLSAVMCFRPVLYAPVFLFFFAFIYYDIYKAGPEGKSLYIRLFVTALLAAVLCLWRSEGIVLIPFCLILIPMAVAGENGDSRLKRKLEYVEEEQTEILVNGRVAGDEDGLVSGKKELRKKALITFWLIFILSFLIVRLPQSAGEKKYYRNDYLILATVRPLSLIIHNEESVNEDRADWENIGKIVKLDYLSYETLSCTSFHRYNSDKNSGSYTQTLASDADRKAYIKSAVKLIWNNMDIYLRERIQLFLITNGIYDYDRSLVMGNKQVGTSEYELYHKDRVYGFELIEGNKRLNINGDDNVIMILFKVGGEAYIPMLFVALFALVVSLIKKKHFLAIMILSLFAREALIFFTAPASFIQYSYPMMFVTAWAFIEAFANRYTERHPVKQDHIDPGEKNE